MNIRTLLALCALTLIVPLDAQEDEAPPPKSVVPAPLPTPTPTPRPRPTPTKTPEPMGTIEGMTIVRGGGFLGLALVGGNFKLTFYDAKKKPVPPDVSRAALRWNPSYKLGGDRVVLNPSGDGVSLTDAKAIRPPFNFKLYITLITDGAPEGSAETFVVDFRG